MVIKGEEISTADDGRQTAIGLSAVWSRNSESVGESLHLSGACGVMRVFALLCFLLGKSDLKVCVTSFSFPAFKVSHRNC